MSGVSTKPTVDRPTLVLLVFVLVVSHVAVFLLARAFRGSATSAGVAVSELAAPGTLPAKASDRSGMDGHGVMSANFRRQLRELRASGMLRADYELAKQALFREWIRRDLRSALEQLYGPLSSAQNGELIYELMPELQAEMVRQGREVWGWILTERFGSRSVLMASHWLSALVAAGQQDLVLELMNGAPRWAAEEAMAVLRGKLTSGQAPALGKLAAAHEDEPATEGNELRYELKFSYADVMGGSVGLDPSAYLNTEKDQRFRLAFVNAWVKKELVKQPAELSARAIRNLPEDLREQAVDELLTVERRGGLPGALRWIDELAGQGLLGEAGGDRERYLLYGLLGEKVDLQTWDGLEGLFLASGRMNDEKLRWRILEKAGREFPMGGEDEDLMKSLPAGADKDALMRGMKER